VADETCRCCGTPMVLGHTVSLDAARATWRICCLCAAELIERLNGKTGVRDG